MKTKIGKYCFSQYFRLIIWTTPKNVSFDQKRAVMGAISQKEGIEILQDTPYIEAFWIPDQLVSSAFMEMKVTLEEGCANGRKKEWWEMRGEWRGKWMFESIFSFSLWLLECEEGGTSGSRAAPLQQICGPRTIALCPALLAASTLQPCRTAILLLSVSPWPSCCL